MKMKLRIFLIGLLIFCFFQVHSQDSLKTDGFEMKTILKQGDKKFLYYGGVWVGMNKMLSGSSLGSSAGVNLAWLAGGSLGIGIAATVIKSDEWWWCGGLYIEPIIKPKYWVHVSFPSVIGMGLGPKKQIEYSTHGTYATARNDFFYLEPGIQAEFNPWKKMRLGLGLKLHFAIDDKLPLHTGPSASELNGISVFLLIKFGKFI